MTLSNVNYDCSGLQFYQLFLVSNRENCINSSITVKQLLFIIRAFLNVKNIKRRYLRIIQ